MSCGVRWLQCGSSLGPVACRPDSKKLPIEQERRRRLVQEAGREDIENIWVGGAQVWIAGRDVPDPVRQPCATDLKTVASRAKRQACPPRDDPKLSDRAR